DVRYFNPSAIAVATTAATAGQSSSQAIFHSQCSSFIPSADDAQNLRLKKFPSLLELLFPYAHETTILTPLRTFLEQKHRFPFYSLHHARDVHNLHSTQDIILDILKRT